MIQAILLESVSPPECAPDAYALRLHVPRVTSRCQPFRSNGMRFVEVMCSKGMVASHTFRKTELIRDDDLIRAGTHNSTSRKAGTVFATHPLCLSVAAQGAPSTLPLTDTSCPRTQKAEEQGLSVSGLRCGGTLAGNPHQYVERNIIDRCSGYECKSVKYPCRDTNTNKGAALSTSTHPPRLSCVRR